MKEKSGKNYNNGRGRTNSATTTKKTTTTMRKAHSKQKRSERIQSEISSLTVRIQQETPPRGYAPPLNQKVAFRALPLSEPTLRGLEGGGGAQQQSTTNSSFSTMTDIQNACIPHALAGRDILGAARTGRYDEKNAI